MMIMNCIYDKKICQTTSSCRESDSRTVWTWPRIQEFKSRLPVTASQIEIQKASMSVITLAEEGTALFEHTRTFGAHLKEVVLSGIVSSWYRPESSLNPGALCYELAEILKPDILRSWKQEILECVMAVTSNQVGALLSPFYKQMGHMHYFPPYKFTEKQAISVAAIMLCTTHILYRPMLRMRYSASTNVWKEKKCMV